MADIQFAPNSEAEGQFDVRVIDNNGSPTNVVEAGTAFNIEVRWRYSNGGNPEFAGDWVFQAFVESIGPGVEKRVAGPVNQSSRTFGKTAALTVPPPAAAHPQPAGESGVNILVVLLTPSKNDNIAGFDERLLRIA